MHPNAEAIAGSMRNRVRASLSSSMRAVPLAGGRASAIKLEPVAHAQQPQRSQANRSGEHEPLEQRLPQRLHVEDEEQIADRAKHERPEDRADRAARAAEERNEIGRAHV